MGNPDLDARSAASLARALGNIRRSREAILDEISRNEQHAMRGHFEQMYRRRIEDEQRDLEDLARQEAILEAELKGRETA